ncbi:MAG: class I SAM-dependent methyltransferase [Candidatus Hodarchaeales archaeon]|jgi:ubiquinone/menaquinone biosynthesis C-methylase UbiE
MGSASVQGELWGQKSTDWANIQEPLHAPLWEAMLTASKASADTLLLDAGCGAGGASVLAAERGARVTGLDASENLVTIARERVPEGNFHVGDIEQLPFDNRTFDAVIAANSIQYAENQVTAIRELGRVCKKDGYIAFALFSTPDKVEYHAIIKAMSDTLPEPPSGGGAFALSEPGKLESLIEQAGLRSLNGGETNCPFEYKDFEIFWCGNAAGGPAQAIMRIVGEKKLRAALQKAVEPFQTSRGTIRIAPNMFRHIVAAP